MTGEEAAELSPPKEMLVLPDSPPESRTRQYITWAFVVALVGAAIYLLASHFLGNQPKATGDTQATIQVHCSACDETFDMPFEDYQAAAPLGTDVSGPIDCPKCGATGSVERVKSGGMPRLRPEGSDTSRDAPEPEPEEYDEPIHPGSHVG